MTTPVPFRKKRARYERYRAALNDRRVSACGSPPVVSLRLRSSRLCACAILSLLPNHRSKQNQGNLGERVFVSAYGVNAADDFAFQLGYGKQIVSSLETLAGIYPKTFGIPEVKARIERMKAKTVTG